MNRMASLSPLRQVALLAGLLVAVAISIPGQARGQCPVTDPLCTGGGGGDFGDIDPPAISISPGTTTVGSRPRQVTVEFCDFGSLDAGSAVITIEGSTITGSFSSTSTSCSGDGMGLTGSVPLDLGVNTLEASICDAASNCATESVTYTFDDDTSPTVEFYPEGGTYTDGERFVQVRWCDDDVLEGNTRSVTIDGSDVTGSLGYTDGSASCGDSRESAGTLTLSEGENVLGAEICDVSGNCITASTTYTYDPPDLTAPSIAIDPPGGSFTDPTVPVTVEWCDAESLDGSTRSISFNGGDVTADFTYADGSQGCAVAKVSSRTLDILPGGNTLEATICDDAGNCGSANETFQYDAPVKVDLTPHNGEYRDVAKCAVDCFDASVSYTTPAYTSMDMPRALTLAYRSSRAAPRGRVVAEVSMSDGSPTPDRYSLKLQRPDGGWVSFESGGQEVFWEGTSDSLRLAAQFDASALETGAHDYTLLVRAWDGSSFEETSIPVTVLVANRAQSPYGAGWSVGGLQRLHFMSDGDVAVSEGDGSVALFEQVTGAQWSHPRGDWTTRSRRSRTAATSAATPTAACSRSPPRGG